MKESSAFVTTLHIVSSAMKNVDLCAGFRAPAIELYVHGRAALDGVWGGALGAALREAEPQPPEA